MAKDLNKVLVIGRLGKDPEIRYTSSGNPVTTFTVASSRQWRDSSGEQRDETEWFNVVAWNKLAEICHQYLGKNARVYIEGRLQTRSWEDQQSGQTRYKTEVVASDMIILENRAQRDTGEEPEQPRIPQRVIAERADYTPPTDIGDEDIPF
jgi:single-strand DNA-binding protein